MLAYVFWHWPKQGTSRAGYLSRLESFHSLLVGDPPRGYQGSRVFAVEGVPGVPQRGEMFEDWYFVDDFTALGTLNEAAVGAAILSTHDAAAELAAGGMAGIYRRRASGISRETRSHAVWLSKPAGISHAGFITGFSPEVEVWQRQMVLGPTPEYCALVSSTSEAERIAGDTTALSPVFAKERAESASPAPSAAAGEGGG